MRFFKITVPNVVGYLQADRVSCGSEVVMVMISWPECHEFETSTTKDLTNIHPLTWGGSLEKWLPFQASSLFFDHGLKLLVLLPKAFVLLYAAKFYKWFKIKKNLSYSYSNKKNRIKGERSSSSNIIYRSSEENGAEIHGTKSFRLSELSVLFGGLKALESECRNLCGCDEAHFWLNGYVNKQNCRIWSEANPQVYVETPLHPEKLTVWCALWAGGILLQKQ
ncbi:hypothetical protein TNCV_4560561 [Trichonephila clavipes]|nr:hypothetical protein TNCV_4560561 [Trichonephila clavipes]